MMTQLLILNIIFIIHDAHILTYNNYSTPGQTVGCGGRTVALVPSAMV